MRTSWLLLGALAVLPSVAGEATDRVPFEWVQVADGVHAALQPAADRFDDSNAVVIVNDHDVIVVDAQADAGFVRALIDTIRTSIGKPVRYVINTHWHGDHTQGNAIYREAFGDPVIFVGHSTLVEDVPGRAATHVGERVERLSTAIPEAEERLKSGVGEDGEPMNADDRQSYAGSIERARRWLEAHRGVRFIAPDTTFEDRMTLHRGGRKIELLHMRAHTRGDTVVFLPAEKVLITGDLLDDLPYVGHGYPREWAETLRRLERLDFETVVPGHGPRFHGKERLRLVASFLESLVKQVEEAVAAGRSLEQTREQVDLSAFRGRFSAGDATAEHFFDQSLAEAVERAYLEARGEIPDGE